MNSLVMLLGLESWKPLLTALLLPPVPLLFGVLLGARWIGTRRGLGWTVLIASVVLLWLGSCTGAALIASVVLLWLGSCTGAARLVERWAVNPPPALSAARLKELKLVPGAKPTTAIVVLGGGLEPLAPEYGVSNLAHLSLERLRFGIWLSRETGLPLAFSGGVGWAQPDAMPEARIAAQIAAKEFGRPLTWVEDSSRDTRENAARSVALLRPAGIRHILLVTHGWHMPRARRAFEAAAGSTIRIEAAPMGLAPSGSLPVLDWLPSSGGTTEMRQALREWLGRLAGA